MAISTKPMDWNTWVWNKDYKGSLAAATIAKVHVDKVYANDADIVAVYKRDGRYYATSFDQATLHEACAVLAVQHPSELEGKTLEAYVTETELVGIRTQREIPASVESLNGVL